MTPAMVNKLRAAFAGTKHCTIEHFERMKGVLRPMKSAELLALREAKIPFVSTAANSLLVSRGDLPESARGDWAIEVVVDKIIERDAPQLQVA